MCVYIWAKIRFVQTTAVPATVATKATEKKGKNEEEIATEKVCVCVCAFELR